MKIRKFIILLLIMALLLINSVEIKALNKISVIVDGQAIESDQQPFIDDNNRTMFL